MALCFARQLDADDREALQLIDQSHALKFDAEPQLTRASVSFYLRTGHSFVAMLEGETVGFVLAQAVWNGTRPTITINCLAVDDAHADVAREALLNAVVKSAYDAAVYDLIAYLPEADVGAHNALNTVMFKPQAVKVFSRVLGSRGNS